MPTLASSSCRVVHQLYLSNSGLSCPTIGNFFSILLVEDASATALSHVVISELFAMSGRFYRVKDHLLTLCEPHCRVFVGRHLLSGDPGVTHREGKWPHGLSCLATGVTNLFDSEPDRCHIFGVKDSTLWIKCRHDVVDLPNLYVLEG